MEYKKLKLIGKTDAQDEAEDEFLEAYDDLINLNSDCEDDVIVKAMMDDYFESEDKSQSIPIEQLKSWSRILYVLIDVEQERIHNEESKEFEKPVYDYAPYGDTYVTIN